VQVDPIKAMLKPPGAKHLRLKCDELLSSFAFKFNLRRYIKGQKEELLQRTVKRDHRIDALAGAYTRSC
jgi:hypothetical protein